MRNEKYNNSCLFGEQLVSYIYDELPAAGRAAFEDHLLDCSGCADEFASVSMSRLGVYEWHRDDFRSLETPVFAIPYERPIAAAESNVTWLDALRGLFSPARLATAGGAFAILVAAFGAFYFSTSYNSQQIAGNIEISVPSAVEQVAKPLDPEVAQTAPPDSETNEKVLDVDHKQANQTTKANHAKVKSAKPNRSVVTQASVTQKAPRLGTFEDAEDTSLRLADLVADIDTDDF